MTNLQKLSIAYNTSDKPLALPNELDACTASMVWLDISGNKYSELPTVITKFTTLQVLEATNNSLKKLPEEFQNLKVLQQLRLSHNELDDLPPALGECVSLQELEISFNQLNTLPLTFGKSKAFIEVIFPDYDKNCLVSLLHRPTTIHFHKFPQKLPRKDRTQSKNFCEIKINSK